MRLLPKRLVEPMPRLGIERLTDQRHDLQARQVIRRHQRLAMPHEHADGRGRGENLVHPVAIDDLVEAFRRRIVNRAFEDHGRHAVGERADNAPDVHGQPADVGRAPEHIVLMVVQVVLRVDVVVDDERHGRVDDALRLARRPARVEHDARFVGFHRLGRTVR